MKLGHLLPQMQIGKLSKIIRTSELGFNCKTDLLQLLTIIIIIFRFIWERTSIILGSSQVIIKWNVPETVLPGEYRIRHNGYYRYILGGVYPCIDFYSI
jgi:hypothetical protein